MVAEFPSTIVMPDQASNESLVNILQQVPPSPAAGDAFTTLYERHLPYLTHYVMNHLVPTRLVEPQDVEDLTQTTFMKALRGIVTYDPKKGALGTWLVAITHNTVVDAHRRRQTGPSLVFVNSMEMSEYKDFEQVDSADGLPESLSFNETLDRLRQGLEPKYVKRLLDSALGISTPEASIRDGIPAGTLKRRMQLAKQRAQAVLADAA
jgi:RNA polymerase sigma factor (sigma-70 family)